MLVLLVGWLLVGAMGVWASTVLLWYENRCLVPFSWRAMRGKREGGRWRAEGLARKRVRSESQLTARPT